METFNFEDIYEFADTLEQLIFGNIKVVVAAPADVMSLLICELITSTECSLGTIELDNEFGDEDHLLGFSNDDEEGIKIWVTPAISSYSKKPMMFNDCNVLLIHEDSNSNIITANKKNFKRCDAFTVGYENDSDEIEFDDEDLEGTIVTNTSKNSVTQSWSDGNGTYFSRSFYSVNPKLMESVFTDWKKFAETF